MACACLFSLGAHLPFNNIIAESHPLNFGAKSTWPPNSPFNSPLSPPQSESSPKTQTASLNINKKDWLKVLSVPPAASPPKDILLSRVCTLCHSDLLSRHLGKTIRWVLPKVTNAA